MGRPPGGHGPAASPHARSRCSGCWPAANRTGKLPSGLWSGRRRRPTTLSTSTPSSVYPAAPQRRCTPRSRAWWAPSKPLADDQALRSAGEPVKETRVIIDETPRREDGRRPKPHASPAYPPASGRGFPPTLTAALLTKRNRARRLAPDRDVNHQLLKTRKMWQYPSAPRPRGWLR